MTVDGKYKVYWKHNTTTHPNYTSCVIKRLTKNEAFSIDTKNEEGIVEYHHASRYTSGKEEAVVEGVAIKYEKDQFCRRIGRYISFKKALSTLDITKDDKKELWKEFWKTNPKPHENRKHTSRA